MVTSVEVLSDLRTGDVYWLVFSVAIRKLTYGIGILAMVLVFLVVLGTKYIAFLALLLLPPFLYLLVGGLIWVALVSPYLRSRAFVRSTMGTSSTISCVVGPQGIDVRRQGWQAHYGWEAVKRAKQTSTLILLYLEGHSALVLPKRCFTSAQQLDDFRSIISSYTKPKASQRDN